MLRVYIAAPLTKGDQFTNLANALSAANEAIDCGFAPFVPHLYAFAHMFAPRSYEEWMRIDDAWLAMSDVLWRLPGVSEGSDREVNRAHAISLPVVYTREELIEARNRLRA